MIGLGFLFGVASIVAGRLAWAWLDRREMRRAEAEYDARIAAENKRAALDEWQREFDARHAPPSPPLGRYLDLLGPDSAYARQLAECAANTPLQQQISAAQANLANQAQLANDPNWHFRYSASDPYASRPTADAEQEYRDEEFARLCRQRGGKPS